MEQSNISQPTEGQEAPKVKNKLEELNNLVKSVFETIDLIKDYINNPVSTTDKIISSNSELVEDFKEIKIGLNGEFTKGKAQDIGKAKLIDYFNNLINSIDTNYNNYIDINNAVLNDLSNEINAVDNNVSFDTLTSRIDKYNANGVTKQFMRLKINSILTGKLNDFVTNAKTLNEFLILLREELAYLRSYEADEYDVEEKYNIYKKQQDYIEFNSGNINLADFDSEYKLPSTTPDTEHEVINNVEERLKEDFRDIVENQPELYSNAINEDVVDLFTSILVEIEPTYNKLVGNIKSFQNGINNLDNNKPYLLNLFNKITNIAVLPYSKHEITTDEFITIIKRLRLLVNDSVNAENVFNKRIHNGTIMLLVKLKVFYTIYVLLNEVVIAGSMPDINSKK